MGQSKINIENVVASASLDQTLDLHKLNSRLIGAKYDQDNFPGVVYRLEDPKIAVLIFESGKLVFTGATSIDHIHTATDIVIEKLRDIEPDIPEQLDITVQNIVASADLGRRLDLNAIAIGLGLEHVEYEPEQFPGLVYRMDDPNVVLLLFGSGKVVCTGGTTPDDSLKGVERVEDELKDLKLL